MRKYLRLCSIVAACLMGAGVTERTARAQALPTAEGAGSYTAVGGGVSVAPSDYDSRNLGGAMAFVDLQPDWHFGFEAEARFLRLNTDEGVDQTNYLFGVRTAVHPMFVRPYAKFLVGETKISAPFGYGRGTFFTMVPGAGVDLMLTDRVSLRLVDVEYSIAPDFIGSNVRNIGVSMGVGFRVNGLSRLPKGAVFSGGHVKHSRHSDSDYE